MSQEARISSRHPAGFRKGLHEDGELCGKFLCVRVLSDVAGESGMGDFGFFM